MIRSLILVDASRRDRFGFNHWLDLSEVEITIYDHHAEIQSDINATRMSMDSVGAVTTLIVEQLQAQQMDITPIEATVMALGIHADTGSLTFDHTTARDAAALAWLMQQGASLSAIANYVDPGLSPQLQELLSSALNQLQTETIYGSTIGWVFLETEEYVPGLSGLASRLLDLTDGKALLLAHLYRRGGAQVLTVIGRSRIEGTDLNALFQPEGGGHAKAAALTLRTEQPQAVLARLVAQLKAQIPQPPAARDLMSAPVRTVPPETTIAEAQRILLRYGHSGLSVVKGDRLIGVISRRDLDIALHHGFAHAPVKGYMSTQVRTISPDTLLPDIESLMVTYDIGRLPVLDHGQLVGIVTRTDVLRQLHQGQVPPKPQAQPLRYLLQLDRLAQPLQQILSVATAAAEQRGWHLYLVGGAVRDLLLAQSEQPVMLNDIDLVVDGFHRSAEAEAGVELARSLLLHYPQARLEVHGKFQTAALLWHQDPDLDSLWVDIATARTEFYPYPAANPEVEASSIRQDLYRRDFTINALALRLTQPRDGELLDFFGGVLDLQAKQVRVLHANSFVEDPTRIYRAVRFAVRLGFEIEAQTQQFIRYAIGALSSAIGGDRTAPALQTRLKAELKYILQALYWQAALRMLKDLDALRCIHPDLELDTGLWWQMRFVDRALRRFAPASLTHWQMLLEVLLARLVPQARSQVAKTLQLPYDSIERLTHLAEVQAVLSDLLPQPPSQIVQRLKPYDLPMLVLVAARVPRPCRRLIWQYLTHWSQVKAPLDGSDLQRLGYKPGKQFKDMLGRLLAATLDGEIYDRSSAERYLAQHYPV
jgi:tRNA nucleotidyltransferase (CCA-adding enzyme)